MRKLTQEEFIGRCKEKHGDKYNYDKTEYVNNRTKIIITCIIHGDFTMMASNHTTQGCQKCVLDNHRLAEISTERLEKFKEVHGDKYVYEDLSVKDGYINIICKNHGRFSQSIYNHRYGKEGCDGCKLDNIEEKRLPIIVKTRVCKYCKVEKMVSEFYPKFQNCMYCSDNYNTLYFTRKSYKDENRKEQNIKNMEHHKNRMRTDPFYRAKIDARNLIRKALSSKGFTKKSKTYEILGCSYIEFKIHLESKFVENMSWDNRDEWHIDHIIPLDFAKNESELLLINNYINLRPLWIFDNLSKNNKITEINSISENIIESR